MTFNEFVKIREEKFGSVIFETLREKVFVTNHTGKKILALLEKNYPVEKIVDVLTNEYSIDATEIRNDVNSFIAQLKENNILGV